MGSAVRVDLIIESFLNSDVNNSPKWVSMKKCIVPILFALTLAVKALL